MITIGAYSEADREEWDQYVKDHPEGTFFHLTGWKRVIEKTFHHRPQYLLAREGADGGNGKKGGIKGIFPLFVVKNPLFCRALVSIPFGAYGGILAETGAIKEELLARAKEITVAENLEYLEIRNREKPIADLPSKDLYFLFRRELSPEVEKNFEAIPRKARRMIRQGEKYNLSAEFGGKERIPEFYETFAHSYHYLGSPVFARKYFVNLMEEFREQANILVVRNEEKRPIASVLTFYYKNEVIPYYAGSLFEYRNLAPNDFIYWHLMKYGCEKGFKIFDFGRSKINTGSYDFKRHWGFEPQPLPYQYFLNGTDEIPNISPVNPRYQKKIELWKKMPFWLTKVLGPQIVKYIP